MGKEDLFYDYLEQPRAIRTLLILFRTPSRSLDEVLVLIGGSKSTGMKRLKDLAQLGLLSKEASIHEPKRIFYRLNDKGVALAQIIIKLGENYNE
jgi:DNA-binding MarR family transcriptional regulator